MGISVPSKSAPFPPETKVEVKGVEDGFTGSWHLATVVASKAPANKRKVRYTYLCEDEAGKHPLEETVDLVNVRPPLAEYLEASHVVRCLCRSREGGRRTHASAPGSRRPSSPAGGWVSRWSSCSRTAGGRATCTSGSPSSCSWCVQPRRTC